MTASARRNNLSLKKINPSFDTASASLLEEEQPHSPLSARRIGILNDYLRLPYANGSSFASQFLYRNLASKGHEVTVIGPDEPSSHSGSLPPNALRLASMPLRAHPGVNLSFPSRAGLDRLAEADFDIVLGQTCSALLNAGVWLREKKRVPFLAVNTVHMPSVYNVLLPDQLHEHPLISSAFEDGLIPFAERKTAELYNAGDGLIALSPGLKSYWRNRGVTVPIHVIPRAIETRIFNQSPGEDPFSPQTTPGFRTLVVCRHTREKEVSRLLQIFATHIVPHEPRATLTLVGDGPDHHAFCKEAADLGIEAHTFFEGEQSLMQMPTWYHHADVFTYTSLSETYGQVISEALWCGLPVVALDDGMGVASQITHKQDGLLISPGASRADKRASNEAFASAALQLLQDTKKRRAYAAYAKLNARKRCDPNQCLDRYEDAFVSAQEHMANDKAVLTNSALDRGRLLAEWTWLHTVAGALGLIRKPAAMDPTEGVMPEWLLHPSAS